jgi:hypothetical protein
MSRGEARELLVRLANRYGIGARAMLTEVLPAAKTERRTSTRHHSPCVPCHITTRLTSAPSEAPMCDLSREGAAVLLPEPIEPGKLITVELFNQTGNFWHLKLLRVVHATPHDESTWKVGGMFLRTLSGEAVEALLSSAGSN